MNSEPRDPYAELIDYYVSLGRCRLHALSFLLLARAFALLLAVNFVQVVISAAESLPRLSLLRVLAEGTLHVALLALLIWFLWSRKRVVATRAGLEVQDGKDVRVLPWSNVVNVRELPWIRFNPPWYPKMWQVDVECGKSFDFIGVRRTRAIVAAFIEHAESMPQNELGTIAR